MTCSNTLARNAASLASPTIASATACPVKSLIDRAVCTTAGLRSTRQTAFTSRQANSLATASPIPLAAPVTSATFPSIFMIFLLPRIRRQESGVRNQGSGDRDQESGDDL